MNAHLAYLRDSSCDMRLIDEIQNRPFILTILSRKTSVFQPFRSVYILSLKAHIHFGGLTGCLSAPSSRTFLPVVLSIVQSKRTFCTTSGQEPTGCATRWCAASAAESECTGRYQGCWKTLCTPDLSLPRGLNSERKGGVKHVGAKGNVRGSHQSCGLSVQSVYG